MWVSWAIDVPDMWSKWETSVVGVALHVESSQEAGIAVMWAVWGDWLSEGVRPTPKGPHRLPHTQTATQNFVFNS